MNWTFLYTSLEGRIGRQQFWVGALVLAVLNMIIVGAAVSLFMTGGGMQMIGLTQSGHPGPQEMVRFLQFGAWFGLFNLALLAWPTACLSIKRRHDRGARGTEIWIMLGLPVLLLLAQATGVGYVAGSTGGVPTYLPVPIVGVLNLFEGLLSLFLFVVLGILKGDSGPNAYGPDPLAL